MGPAELQSADMPASGPSTTAFRTAEKLYQLRYEEVVKPRRTGRPKRGRLIAREISMDAVLDLAADCALYSSNSSKDNDTTKKQEPTPPDSWVLAGVRRHEGVTGLNGPAYTFAAHPGLVYLPAAIPPSEQLQLAYVTLQHLVEPPAKTNHTAQYGYLPGLIRAAQLSFRLQHAPAPPARCSQSHCTRQEPGSEAKHGQGYSAGPTRSFEATWGAGGMGPSAKELLGKLRWATLGPQYNWTARVYDMLGEHRPLPEPFCQLARELAGVAAGLTTPTSAAAVLKASPPSLSQPPSVTAHEPLQDGLEAAVPVLPQHAPSAGRCCAHPEAALVAGPAARVYEHSTSTDNAASAPVPPVASCADNHDELNVQQPVMPRAYAPDAALVSFYPASGSLCGHRDDVEHDQAQPIVSISLGAAAIFLMGYSTRHGCSPTCRAAGAADERSPGDNGCGGERCAGRAPMALLVRSGDVLVLGGAARQCFHGIPRILPDIGLPTELCPGAVAPDFRVTAQYMATSRINISIRAIM